MGHFLVFLLLLPLKLAAIVLAGWTLLQLLQLIWSCCASNS